VSNDQTRPGWKESDRLSALRSYRILDTPPEPGFDDLVQLAARACRAPVALISLVDDRRQWFKAEVGLGRRETPIELSFCSRAILQPGLFVVPDLSKDPRFDCNPLVLHEPRLRFYASALLETPDGLPLGTMCVLDYVPRELSEDQAFMLTTLAREVMSQLELRRAILERDEALAASREAEQRQALLVRELHHRVRNSLAMVQALLGATSRTTGTVEEFYRAFSARISSLARTQTLLTEDAWQTVPLRELVLKDLRAVGRERPERFGVEGPPVELSADLAVPLGMALHELTSNAVRHGALSRPAGRVDVTWDVVEDGASRRLRLEWRERGGPRPARAPEREGFGWTLLRKVLPMQASAEVEVTFDPEGVRCRIEAPLVERQPIPPLRRAH
jgi:two-component sensor histidine kinase